MAISKLIVNYQNSECIVGRNSSQHLPQSREVPCALCPVPVSSWYADFLKSVHRCCLHKLLHAKFHSLPRTPNWGHWRIYFRETK